MSLPIFLFEVPLSQQLNEIALNGSLGIFEESDKNCQKRTNLFGGVAENTFSATGGSFGLSPLGDQTPLSKIKCPFLLKRFFNHDHAIQRTSVNKLGYK